MTGSSFPSLRAAAEKAPLDQVELSSRRNKSSRAASTTCKNKMCGISGRDNLYLDNTITCIDIVLTRISNLAIDLEDDRCLDRSDESPSDSPSDNSSLDASDDRDRLLDRPSPREAVAMAGHPDCPERKISRDDVMESIRIQSYAPPYRLSDPRLWPQNMLPAMPPSFLPFNFHRLHPHFGLSHLMSARANTVGEHALSLLHGGAVITGCNGAAFSRRFFPFAAPPPYLPLNDAGRQHLPVNVQCHSAPITRSPGVINATGKTVDEPTPQDKVLAVGGRLPWLVEHPAFKVKSSADEGCVDKTLRRPIEAPRYQCDACSKSYATFSGLSKHKQFHCESHVKKQFSCKFCEKTYTSLGALKMHIRTHTLPCKCHVCGKAFSRPWLLQGHLRTHTGEKPFSCPHCGRAFADRSNLRAHLQTHSDVKKYCCKRCTKTFSRMSLLLKHEDGSCPVQTGARQPDRIDGTHGLVMPINVI